MANYPAIPTSVNQQVKQALEMMLGFRGDPMDRAVLLRDLVDSGVVALKPGALTGNKTNTSTGNLIDPAAGTGTTPGELPDKPTTPSGLTTVSGFSAILLAWIPASYTGHSYTEVYRAQVDDPAQAEMIHEEPTSSYTDVVEHTGLTHYYWIRHVSTDGTKSGFNAYQGTAGEANAHVTAADFFLVNSEFQGQPFNVVNLGTEAEPDWRVAIDSAVVINGSLNISNLVSGELSNGVVFSIGNGSIQMGTANDGTGEIIITGAGGLATNDYLRMNAGRIESFVYDPAVGHVPYKEVRRVERGITNSGAQVKIPAYFRQQPQVYLTPATVLSYNSAYPAQSQQFRMDTGNIEPHPTENGAWVFTPVAVLELADGTEVIAYPERSLTTSNDSYIFEITNQDNVSGFTVNARIQTQRHTGSGNSWQKRIAGLTVHYKKSSDSNWSLGDFEDILDIADFNMRDVVLNVSGLPADTYDIKLVFYAADGSGTFTSGALEYDYDTRVVNASNWVLDESTKSTGSSYTQVSGNLVVAPPSLPGWEIYEANWSFNWSVTLTGYGFERNSSSSKSSNYVSAKGYGKIDADFLYKQINGPTSSTQAPYTDWNYNYADEFGAQATSQTFNGSQSYTVTDSVLLSAGKYTSRSTYISGDTVDHYAFSPGANVSGYPSKKKIRAGRAVLTVSSIQVTYKYRKPKAVTGTPANSFFLDSVNWNKGAQDISMQNVAINWLAVGE